MEILGTCSELLVAFLKPHGIIAVHNDGIVTVPEHSNHRFVLQVYESGENTVSLEAMCRLPSGQLMIERLAGIGDTQKDAILDVQTNFANSVFHVWLSALLGKPNQFAKEYVWKVNGTDRNITVGFPTARGEFEAGANAGWQDAWHSAVRELPLSSETHWASICYCQNAGKLLACDTLVDNNDCESAKEKVLSFAWPARDKFYLIRQFLIIQEKT